MRTATALLAASSACLLFARCGSAPPAGPDAAAPAPDAQPAAAPDSGADASSPAPADAALAAGPDASAPLPDAASPGPDASSPARPDAGFARTTCGNGRLDAREPCDGARVAADSTCAANNLGGGVARCREDCSLDVSGCSVKDYCEGNFFYSDQDCDACELMGGHADPACAAHCGADGACASWFDPSVGLWSCAGAGFGHDPDCGSCGNGTLEGNERCDGTAFFQYQGVDLGKCENWSGYTSGTMGCFPDCTPDFTNCAP